MPRTISNDQGELVRLAIAGIDAQIRELEEKRSTLLRLIGAGRRANAPKAAPGESGRKKRVFSAATKRRLSIAAKRRWARARAEKKSKL